METILVNWLMRWWSLRLTSCVRHSMDELMFGASNWTDRNTRQAIQMLSPSLIDGDPLEEPSPHLVPPIPTDVPVPDPTDVPVPDPMDVPPPEPHDVPPVNPPQPEFDPQPRSVP